MGHLSLLSTMNLALQDLTAIALFQIDEMKFPYFLL